MPRNPDNQNLTLYENFYLPDYGARGLSVKQLYDEAHEKVDRLIKEIHDHAYGAKSVLGYSLVPPTCDWFHTYEGLPHHRSVRGYWNFNNQVDDQYCIDTSEWGNDAATRFTCHVNDPNFSWVKIKDLRDGNLTDEQQNCLDGNFLDVFNFDDFEEDDHLLLLSQNRPYIATIPGLFHDTQNVDKITIEFCFCPTTTISPIKKEQTRYIMAKQNISSTNTLNYWVSEEFAIGFYDGSETCDWDGGNLSIWTHRLQDESKDEPNPLLMTPPTDPCKSEDNTYAWVGTNAAVWSAGVWYYCRFTIENDYLTIYSEQVGNSENVQDVQVYNGSIPKTGNSTVFTIGGYWKRGVSTGYFGINGLIANLRLSTGDVTRTSFTPTEQLVDDEYTLCSYKFIEKDKPVYTLSNIKSQNSNFPTYNIDGFIKTGAYGQPQDTDTLSSSPDNLKCARFSKHDFTFLNAGNEYYSNCTPLDSNVFQHFSVSALLKRNSVNSNQCIISKWDEEENKRFFRLYFDENNRVVFELTKGSKISETVETVYVENPYTYVTIDTESTTYGKDYAGTYITEESFDYLYPNWQPQFDSIYYEIKTYDLNKPQYNGYYLNQTGWQSEFGSVPGGYTWTYNGQDVWRHTENPQYCIYKWTGSGSSWWLMGNAPTSAYMDNLVYDLYMWVIPGKTDDVLPEIFEKNYNATSLENNDFGSTKKLVASCTKYPLTWKINGNPVFRQIDDIAFCAYRDVSPWNGWFGWILGVGSDYTCIAYWALDTIAQGTDGFPESWTQGEYSFNSGDIEITEIVRKRAVVPQYTRDVISTAGVDTFRCVSADTIEDTTLAHMITATWSQLINSGKPKIFIDGYEVLSYDIQESYNDQITLYKYDDEYQKEIIDWPNINIGRCNSINISNETYLPSYYLDADVQEVILWATYVEDEYIEELWKHTVHGGSDGDRFMIYDITGWFDPDKKVFITERAVNEWQSKDSYFAEWRRHPITAQWGWLFISVKNKSCLFWNSFDNRLESWMPFEFYEKYGDYGVTGSFKVN